MDIFQCQSVTYNNKMTKLAFQDGTFKIYEVIVRVGISKIFINSGVLLMFSQQYGVCFPMEYQILASFLLLNF